MAPAALADASDGRNAKPSRSQRGVFVPYVNPMGSRPVTATFGEHGSWWFQGVHDGIDYDAEIGERVSSACAGVVVFAGSTGNWAGKHVIVRCGTGLKLTYAHLSRVDVAEGDVASLGSSLGGAGDSGNVTGSHLHVSAEMDGKAVDPSDYIPR